MNQSMRRPLPPRAHLYRRLAGNGLMAVGVVAVSLSVGALGYHRLEGMAWLDAFYSAAMILTGMGPSTPLTHSGSKVFAIFYALVAGVVFLTVMTLVLGPVLYRFLHRFHLETTAGGDSRK